MKRRRLQAPFLLGRALAGKRDAMRVADLQVPSRNRRVRSSRGCNAPIARDASCASIH
jgi:hypothetical protein